MVVAAKNNLGNTISPLLRSAHAQKMGDHIKPGLFLLVSERTKLVNSLGPAGSGIVTKGLAPKSPKDQKLQVDVKDGAVFRAI
jgi:hypothetical protein